ncbi:MAG: FlgD immunoglobulin-like domain containing protein [Cytophagales bacterium]
MIFGRKGAAAGTARVFRTATSPAVQQSLVVNRQVSARFSNGTLKSPLIGPANKWFNFIPQITQTASGDSFYFQVYGVDLNGRESLLFDNIVNATSLSTIDANKYPLLQVVLKMQDPINLTPVQLKKWFVTYESVAEGILIYRGGVSPLTVKEGQSVSLPFAFVNISSKNFGGQIQVDVQAVSQAAKAPRQPMLVIAAPKPGDSTKFDAQLSTRGRVGINDVSVFANPRVLPEVYYDNNALLFSQFMNVQRDNTPPVLEAWVDGRQLVNNDFVSSNPKVLIVLKDENRFLFKSDTTGITIFLKADCSNCSFQPIYFSRPDVNWSAATAQSDLIVNFNPLALAAGTYTLRVQAQDASGNRAGSRPYEVTFRVAEVSALELRSVFPNPSGDRFYFNFILSGSELPSEFSLQIFTLDGRRLQTFTTQDVGLFRIGINQLAWDGRDDDGNAMPNGFYTYKLSVLVAGKNYIQQGKLVLAK